MHTTTPPALHRLTGVCADLVRAKARLDAAEAAYKSMFTVGRRARAGAGEPLTEWQQADAAFRAAWHEFVRVTNEATLEQIAATVPHPEQVRLPFAVELAHFARQAEMRRQFEAECA